jgi:hypothetical protein
VKIPDYQTGTVAAIQAAYVAEATSWDQFGINVGELGGECDRALYYSFRWCSPLEVHNGSQLRLFATGNIEEDRLVADLERAGIQVFGMQERIRFVSGHVRGKIDGKAIGLPESPKTEHLVEFKSSNHKNFVPYTKGKTCKEHKPLHYVQCQLGMHGLGLTRCLYLVVNKNDDTLYSERIEYDAEFCIRILAKAERIVNAQEPPARISEKPDYYACGFCRHAVVCHYEGFPRTTCRSCISSTPEMGGDAAWSCDLHNKPLSFDEQKRGCGDHLFDPALVPFEQVDSSEELRTITYKTPDGGTWVDGEVA